MADFKNLTLTILGAALLEKAIAGTTLEFTRAAIGDGRVADGTDISGLTALVNEKKSIPINSIEFKEGLVTVTIAFSNSDLSVGFHVRELGLFAKDPEKDEILYAVANAGDDADWLPEMGSNVVEEVFKIVPVVSGATKVTAVMDSSLTYITKEEFEAHHHVTGGQNDGEQVEAKDVVNTPSGLITATTVQTAINQLYNFCFAWQPKASYAVGDICYSPNTNGYKRFECVFAGTSGAAEPSWTEIGTLITDGTVTWIVDDIRDGMRVGDIVLRYSLRDGYIKANGGQIKASDYPRLLKYVKDNNLSTTETLWQVGAYDKYVYDSSLDTLRIPNLVNRFLEGSDAESIIGAGLPNITGAFPVSAALASSYSSGAFYVSSSFSGNGQDSQPNFLIGFSAARANSIYGNSTTVQPAAIKLIAQVKY